MSRLKLLILDACVVIQLHELGRWQQVVDRCDIHLSEIVARREVKFDDANETRIDLEPAILSKAITLSSVEALKVAVSKLRAKCVSPWKKQGFLRSLAHNIGHTKPV